MLDDLGFEEKHKNYCIRKITTIAIRTTYYIFCAAERRNGQIQNYQLFEHFIVYRYICYVCHVIVILYILLVIQVAICKLPWNK